MLGSVPWSEPAVIHKEEYYPSPRGSVLEVHITTFFRALFSLFVREFGRSASVLTRSAVSSSDEEPLVSELLFGLWNSDKNQVQQHVDEFGAVDESAPSSSLDLEPGAADESAPSASLVVGATGSMVSALCDIGEGGVGSPSSHVLRSVGQLA